VSKRWARHSVSDSALGQFSVEESRSPLFADVPSPAAVHDATRARLADIIDGDIIPRLLAMHSDKKRPVPPARAFCMHDAAEHIDELAAIAVADGSTEAMDYIENLRERGARLEDLFEHLVAPAARRLGQLWEDDVCDFVDVARGIGRLQQIIRHFGFQFIADRESGGGAKCLLLAALPGERHTLGLSLVREFFCRAGWHVDYAAPKSAGDLVALLKSEWFDALGLSATVVPDPVELAADIRRFRSASRNKRLTILAGGRAFAQRPELVVEVGADGSALNGEQAVGLISKPMQRANAADGRARRRKS
jgi:methanogenic corrinoid protein MtbC1